MRESQTLPMSSEIHGPQTDFTEQPDERRLDSWKEIAAYFQRDTRTVRRWEQTRKLPVRRVPGRRGYVFAYVGELDQWLRSADATVPDEDDPADDPPTDIAFAPSDADPAVGHMAAAPDSSSLFRMTARAAGAALALGLLATFAFAVMRHRHAETAVAAAPGVSAFDLSESQKFTLRGKYYWDRRTEGGLQQALDAYTQAVVHDNNNARAYAGLAETYDLLPEYGSMAKSDAFPRAIAAANRAIALDPALADGHRALAFGLFFWDWDVNRALSEYRIALQLDPQDFETHHWLSTALLTLGRGPESLAEIRRARALRPSSRSIVADEAFIEFTFHGDPADSIATLRELERTDVDFVTAPRYLSDIFFDLHRYQEYIAASARAAAITHDESLAAVMREAQAGWLQDGERGMLLHMRSVQETQFAKGQVSGFELARTCALQGDKAAAVHYLQQGFAAHDYMLLTVLGGQIQDQLHDVPQFLELQADIRKRMNHST